MNYKLMDAFNVVVKDMVAGGIPETQAEAIIKKVIWVLICRL